VRRFSPAGFSAPWTEDNSARSAIFVATPATVRSSPVGAAYSSSAPGQMPPLRGLDSFVGGTAITMSLLTELVLEVSGFKEVGS